MFSRTRAKKIKDHFVKLRGSAHRFSLLRKKQHLIPLNIRNNCIFKFAQSQIHGFGIFANIPLRRGDEIIDTYGLIERYCNDAAKPNLLTQWDEGVNENYTKLVEDYETRSLLHVNIVRRLELNTVYLCIRDVAEDEEILISYGLKRWSRELQSHCCLQ